jgi:radical SAM protein with 4Fe4S-binding SPASM domain
MKKKLFTDVNIKRIDDFLDKHLETAKNLKDGAPPFSSVEISINGACNRRCFFCPRVDKEGYPNILSSLNMKVFDELINDLESINYQGRIAFSGFCEPLLSKNLDEYILKIKEKLTKTTVEIVSNGDPLLAKNGKERLTSLYKAGLDTIKISLYDGPHQIELFDNIKKDLNLSDEQYIVRKRYLGPDESFGITISNRAGSVTLKNEEFELKALKEPLKQPCYYPFYKVLIDHDGDVLMCSNDWKKEKSMGNLSKDSLLTIWSNKKFVDLRKKLLNSDRSHKPCNVCDVNGILNGKKSFEKWKNHLSK